MLTDYSLELPRAVYSGEHALEQIKTILTDDVKRVAVFTDHGIEHAGILEYPLSLIRSMGKEITVFDELPAEPTCDQAQKVIDRFKAVEADFIVAIGGGSVMDIAKLASVLTTEAYGVRELIENPSVGRKQIRTLMIPTTAGTGSEATPNSIVAIPEKELKVGIVNREMIADAVILDGRMTKKLPRHIAAATGVDALAHAIECYTSKKANPFSDIFALEALDLILNHIEQVYDDPDDGEARTAMLLGAFYAGAAITASGTTAVHALSYPLGGRYHIPHGVSNAMLLVPVMRYNEAACRTRLAQAYDRVVHDARDETKEAEKADRMLRRLEHIVKHLEIPTSLGNYGVSEEDLEILVASGMEVKRLLVNNMREMTEDAARKLYRQIM